MKSKTFFIVAERYNNGIIERKFSGLITKTFADEPDYEEIMDEYIGECAKKAMSRREDIIIVGFNVLGEKVL